MKELLERRQLEQTTSYLQSETDDSCMASMWVDRTTGVTTERSIKRERLSEESCCVSSS